MARGRRFEEAREVSVLASLNFGRAGQREQQGNGGERRRREGLLRSSVDRRLQSVASEETV